MSPLHPPRRRSRVAIVALSLLCVLLFAIPATAEDWRQFRGPEGRAVSSEVKMPKDFGATSAELKWKQPLPGSGISSPIVSGDRVFVTTAYQGGQKAQIRGRTILALVVLGGITVLALVIRRLARKKDIAEPPPGWVRFLVGLDGLAVIATTLGFVAIAVAAAAVPEKIWTPGMPGNTWLMTGPMALAGVVAAVGMFRPRSKWRLLGILLLLGAGAWVLQNLPVNKHREVYKLIYRVVLVAPAAAGALWYLFLFLLVRRRRMPRSGVTGAVASLCLVGMAGGLFVSSNYLLPAAGLNRALLCYDLPTGEQVWDKPLFVAPEERLHIQNSWATPTPCTDGERVFAYFGPGYACVDFDGNILWEGRDKTYHDASRYGCVTSPVLFEDTFIVDQECEENLRTSYIMALDKITGEVRWRIEPENASDSYMTPSLIPVGGSIQLVIVTTARVMGYDPRTGEELWRRQIESWQHAPSLTWRDDLLFVSGGAHMKFVTTALRLSGEGKNTKAEEVWKSTRNVPDSSSPVLYENVYVTASAEGIVTAYEPETGKRLWRQRVKDGGCLPSLIAGDGKILLCTETGKVQVFDASPDYHLVSEVELGETIRATPAIGGGRVLIRTLKNLYCFQGTVAGDE